MSKQEALEVEAADGRLRPALGQLVINTRVLLLLGFLALTIFFGFQVTKLRPDASF